MRLINTSTYVFEEFIGKHIPKYTILSHTWEQEEVTFKDMTTEGFQFKKKKGYRKIEKTCQMASQAGYRYAWIDACCIDKSSSAELTEAINSMYLWYKKAEICYAFLSDLPSGVPLEESLRKCRWFTRGWTLQELIAPRRVEFYDQSWNNRGSKADLVRELSEITNVDPGILRGEKKLSAMSIAQRMSWAAHRETTRVEDMAYSLLGIFDVNIPLLYGEQEKAFRRLQEEIIKTSADLSILAWKWPVGAKRKWSGVDRVYCGVLADSPRNFSGSKALAKLPLQEWRDYSLSNNGLKIQAQLLSLQVRVKGLRSYVLPVNCSSNNETSIGIQLRMCGPGQFIREDPWSFVGCPTTVSNVPQSAKYLLTAIPEVPGNSPEESMRMLIPYTRSHVLRVAAPTGMFIYDVWPGSRHDREDRLFFVTVDTSMDYAMMRLYVSLSVKRDGQFKKEYYEFWFYAIGWSSLDASKLHCTLVEYRQYMENLNKFRAQNVSEDYNSYRLLRELSYHDIPHKNSVSFAIEGTKQTVTATFTPSVVEDPKICRNPFWDMKFSFDIVDDIKSP